MKFLKQRFYDDTNIIKSFLTDDNCLLNLESEDNKLILSDKKLIFVQRFIDSLIKKGIINDQIIKSVNPQTNPWSIDFPSWHGPFDEEKGKEILIIGSEPHIHNEYLQTVYGFNNEISIENYINKGHPIFKFISEILSSKLEISQIEVMKKIYLTDLFPLSPLRGNGTSVGSADKLQNIIGDSGNWVGIRSEYAKENLSFEIDNVKPKIILCQGKDVLKEVIKILNVGKKIEELEVIPKTGKRQFIRYVEWNSKMIISVPHIGTKRMRTFWINNIDKVKEKMKEIKID